MLCEGSANFPSASSSWHSRGRPEGRSDLLQTICQQIIKACECSLQEFSELHPLCRHYLAQQNDLLDRLVPAVQSLEHYLDQPLQHHNYQDALKVFEMVVLRWGCPMGAHPSLAHLSAQSCRVGATCWCMTVPPGSAEVVGLCGGLQRLPVRVFDWVLSGCVCCQT